MREILIYLGVLLIGLSVSTTVTYTTPCGPVTGNVLSANGLNEFLGVRYATPDTQRFRPSAEITAWSGVADGTHYGASCIQPAKTSFGPTSEDCLYLNIWTPAQAENLPVLVFIHGGGFLVGSGSDGLYNGSLLAQTAGAVVVTLNYRLGFLGFSAVGENDDGPRGFGDQQTALQWIQHNIAAFGGDPTHVTLSGQSAGSFSVQMHYVAPASNGLFSAGIMVSATQLGIQTLSYTQNVTQIAAAQLGCTMSDAASRVTCLNNLPSLAFADLANDACPKLLHCWFPYQSPSGPLPAQPMDAVAAGNVANAPLLVGSTLNDSTQVISMFQYDLSIPTPFTMEDANDVLVLFLQYAGQDLQDVYTEYSETFSTYSSNYTAAAQAVTDAFMAASAVTWAIALEQRGIPAYVYRFDFFGESIFPSHILNPELYGVCHLMDLAYIFGHPCFMTCDAPPFVSSFDAAGLDTVATMQKIWTSFIHAQQPGWAPVGTQLTTGMFASLPSYTPLSVYDSRVQFWSQMPPIVL